MQIKMQLGILRVEHIPHCMPHTSRPACGLPPAVPCLIYVCTTELVCRHLESLPQEPTIFREVLGDWESSLKPLAKGCIWSPRGVEGDVEGGLSEIFPPMIPRGLSVEKKHRRVQPTLPKVPAAPNFATEDVHQKIPLQKPRKIRGPWTPRLIMKSGFLLAC